MTLGQFIGASFRDPAGTAAVLKSWHLARGTLVSMVALIVVLSVLVLITGLYLAAADEAMIVATPFALCLVLGASLIMLMLAIQVTGRMFGGTGTLDQAVLLVVWWQAMALVVQVAQTVIMLIVPPVAGLIAIAGLVWLVFALLHFVNVLHGFNSLLKALATVVIGMVAISFGLALVLTLVGVTLQGASV